MLGPFALALVLAGTSLAAAVAGLLLVHLYLGQSAARRRREAAVLPQPGEDAVFLFDEDTLVDASDSARALLDGLPPAATPLAQLLAWATPRFPGVSEGLSRLAETGRLRLASTGPPPRLMLTAEWRGGLARLTLQDRLAEGQTVPVDRLSLAATEDELAQLRGAVEQAPLPVWREGADGAVIWANPAYLRLASASDAAAGVLTWPLPRLFAVPVTTSPRPVPAAADGPVPDRQEPAAEAAGCAQRGPAVPPVSWRAELPAAATGGPRWFDCIAIAEEGEGRLCYGLPADATVKAESSLRDLVQTLSRTFAHLPVGLAVFDRQRRLQLFNPALGDLTTLSPAFLTARPGFEAFFDALRERQMIPEPKDYRAWRQSLTEMERAAVQGHYQEVWSLTTGQTYRVTGRPHPDGAVAFLIEDVSAEISLTRRFRDEIRTGQAVLDSLPQAIAVFSSAGTLVMSNAAYAEIWGSAPDTLVGEVGVAEALRLWTSLSHPGPHWAQLRTLIGAGGPRRGWEGAIQLRDGRHMTCVLTPLAGGATMVGFHPVAARPEAVLPRRAATGPG